MKAKLIYLGNAESRVCLICFEHLANSSDELNNSIGAIGGNIRGTDRPNPNNPMEYCSVIPPHQQVSNSIPSPISVMVPIGVLKREGMFYTDMFRYLEKPRVLLFNLLVIIM